VCYRSRRSSPSLHDGCPGRRGGHPDHCRGRLQIDETKGIDCCSATGAHSKRLIYTPGTTYRIAVLCEYKGGNDAIGQTAQSGLEGPDGAVDTKPIWEAVKSTVL